MRGQQRHLPAEDGHERAVSHVAADDARGRAARLDAHGFLQRHAIAEQEAQSHDITDSQTRVVEPHNVVVARRGIRGQRPRGRAATQQV